MSQRQPHVVNCETAKELLDSLSPRGEMFAGDWPHAWAFRGHAVASWPLIPSAFRSRAALAVSKFPPNCDWQAWTNAHQIHAEVETLQQFIAEADGAGLPIPQESAELREQISFPFKAWYDEGFEQGEFEWPPRIAWPLVALAQHHGLATRFLDWTYSSGVAAYFAATDALSKNSTEPIAVWAFSIRDRNFFRATHVPPFGDLPLNFPEIVVAPYAGNPNLRAQEGLHIAIPARKLAWRAPADRLEFTPHFMVIDQDSSPRGGRSLIKFTLPSARVSELLWNLAKERVTAARLFPGYSGAARSVMERQIWPPDSWPT